MRWAPVALLAALAIAGCGAPGELSEEDGRKLATARERLDDALDTEETLRTSKAEARALRRRAQRIVSDGSFEAQPLDEFGLAKLGLLQEVVPSLVVVNERGALKALDRPATAAFLRYAERDAAQALLLPARRQVELIARTLEDTDAGSDTDIPVVRQTAGEYVRDIERAVHDIWPALARRLTEVRERL